MFEIYSSDMYWVKNSPHPDERLTLDIVLDDIKSLIDELKSEGCVLFDHSAHGIIELEFAKKYPDIAKGIIMVGTPVNCNASVGIKNQRIFELEADHPRKMIDRNNREAFQQTGQRGHPLETLCQLAKLRPLVFFTKFWFVYQSLRLLLTYYMRLKFLMEVSTNMHQSPI